MIIMDRDPTPEQRHRLICNGYQETARYTWEKTSEPEPLSLWVIVALFLVMIAAIFWQHS